MKTYEINTTSCRIYKLDANEYIIIKLLYYKDFTCLSDIVMNLDTETLNKLQDKFNTRKIILSGKITGPSDVILNNQIVNKILDLDKNEEVENWIEEWRNLWKTDRGSSIKSGSYYVLDNTSSSLKRMKKYIKENPNHSKDTIIKATKKYIEERRKARFDFMKKSSKFVIEQDGSSVLYQYCEAILNPDSHSDSYFFDYSKDV